jgi:hypothetical protein
MAALALVGYRETVARARSSIVIHPTDEDLSVGAPVTREFLEDNLAGLAVGNLSGINETGAVFGSHYNPV